LIQWAELNNADFLLEAAGVGDLHPVEMLQDQVIIFITL